MIFLNASRNFSMGSNRFVSVECVYVLYANLCLYVHNGRGSLNNSQSHLINKPPSISLLNFRKFT